MLTGTELTRIDNALTKVINELVLTQKLLKRKKPNTMAIRTVLKHTIRQINDIAEHVTAGTELK